MTKTINRYEIPVKDDFVIKMPDGAELLTLQVQHERPCLWVLFDPGKPVQERCFRLYGNGHQIDDAAVTLRYVGTFQLLEGSLVLHLFEVVTVS